MSADGVGPDGRPLLKAVASLSVSATEWLDARGYTIYLYPFPLVRNGWQMVWPPGTFLDLMSGTRRRMLP